MIKFIQSCVDLPPYENKVVNIVKAKHDLRTKQDAILFIIKEYNFMYFLKWCLCPNESTINSSQNRKHPA